jgi:hypothetical protein
MSEPLPTLPKAPVLGYFSNISTPTRVRAITARIVFLIAILHFVGTAVFLLLTSGEFWEAIENYVPGVTSASVVAELLIYVFWFAVAFTVSTLLAVFSRAIRRGRRTAVFLTLIYLLFLTVVSGITTISFAVIFVVVSFRGAESIGQYLLPAVVFLGVLVTLFLKELSSFLYWIARHPAAEM